MKKNIRILVVGDVMLDRYWFGDVSRISPEAPVPVVLVEKREERLGGAANVARNTSALGATTDLLGIVGQDEAGDTVSALLKQSGIGDYLKRDTAISTIIKLRVVARQQQLLRVDFEEPPSDSVLQNKLSQYHSLLPQYDVIVLSDYAKGALLDVAKMIAAAREAGKIVLVDPKGDDFTRYAGATILTPNKGELRRIVGNWKTETELTEKAQQLRASLNIQSLLLTRSEEGMTLYSEEGITHMPAQAREVFDVSGAGDTVIATLAAMIGEGLSLKEAAALSNRAGGIVVGKLGTATVSRAELFGS
ncbi:MAG: D-glycero-beta-D-manno-heptose-7-phosphate kinase [Oxalobacter sp.]|nr:MAG: D-glycero-beta-D-manno-heptose-7-phosphate kinase [Oxalobacter sp.]